MNRPRWRRIASHPLTHLLAALVVIALLQTFVVKLYQVPSGSMEQTLRPGDRILANRLAYVAAEPHVGDVVVFARPDGWDATPREDPGILRSIVGFFGDLVGFGPSNESTLVKRIVAVAGQTVQCCDAEGRIERDGDPVDEPYLGSDLAFDPGVLDCASTPASSRCFAPITVPDGSYLVLGDNRAASSDSLSACRGGGDPTTCARFVPRSDIVGQVFQVLWPLSRWGQTLD